MLDVTFAIYRPYRRSRITLRRVELLGDNPVKKKDNPTRTPVQHYYSAAYYITICEPYMG